MTDHRDKFYWQRMEQEAHERRHGYDGEGREARGGNPFAPLIVLAMIVIVLMAVLSESGSGAGGVLRALSRLL